nr:bile acid:sodium symporter family protein [uncultured Caproiciproducens sp.]
MENFNAFIEKWMALVTPLCLFTGVFFASQFSQILFLVPYVFAFMTFCGSLGSKFSDIGRVVQHPLPLLAALFVIHLVLPLLALTAGTLFFPQSPYIITGMVLEFVIPSAVVSAMWVSIYRGSAPFTLSVILIDTLLAPFCVPLSLHLFVGSNVQVDTASMMKDLLLMVAVPALLAMTLNQLSGGTMKQTLSPKLAPFGKIALMIVVCANSSKVAPFIRNMTPRLFAVSGSILLLAMLGYAIGWLVAALLKQKRELVISMTFSCGMRNISAGAVIAAAYFPAEVMFPVMIGTLFQQILAACFAQLLTKRYGAQNAAA